MSHEYPSEPTGRGDHEKKEGGRGDERVEEDARDWRRRRLRQGVRVKPLCRAVMGWLCGEETAPYLADIRLSGDGLIWIRLSDEAEASPVGTFGELLG